MQLNCISEAVGSQRAYRCLALDGTWEHWFIVKYNIDVSVQTGLLAFATSFS